MRKILSASMIAAQLSVAYLAIPTYGHAAAQTHKMRSAHFIVTALEKKGLKVLDSRRKAQVYFLYVADDAGSEAILAVDGFSAEIIGLTLLKLGPGVTATPAGSKGKHFVDLTYVYGYVIEESVYMSYTEITTEELSITEEYSEVSYEETEEVSYEEVEDTAESDLDEGTAEDSAGDDMADDGNGATDQADDGADDASADDSAGDDGADDGGADDGGADDGGADDGGADDGGDEG